MSPQWFLDPSDPLANGGYRLKEPIREVFSGEYATAVLVHKGIPYLAKVVEDDVVKPLVWGGWATVAPHNWQELIVN